MVRWKSAKAFHHLMSPRQINASSIRLPLGSLELSTRVPNTGRTTPQSLRRTEPQRSVDLDRKKGKVRPVSLFYNTLHLHFVAARDAETQRARKQQQGNAVATVAAALQSRHKEIYLVSFFGVCACVRVYLQRCVVSLRTIALMRVSAFGINVRFCFGFTAAKPVAAEAGKIAAKGAAGWSARLGKRIYYCTLRTRQLVVKRILLYAVYNSARR